MALPCGVLRCVPTGAGMFQAVVILLGADKKQAAILRRYCEGLLQAPMLAPEVTRQTGEVIEFRNGASLEIATNDARLVRGRSAIAVFGSECCHWRTDEHAAPWCRDPGWKGRKPQACLSIAITQVFPSTYLRRGPNL